METDQMDVMSPRTDGRHGTESDCGVVPPKVSVAVS